MGSADRGPTRTTAPSRLNSRRRPGLLPRLPSSVGNPVPRCRDQHLPQPSWIQRNPLLAGLLVVLPGRGWGMIFGRPRRVRTTEGASEQAAGGARSNGMLLLLMVMGGGALWWYMRSRRTPAPNFSGSSHECRGSLPGRIVQCRFGDGGC